MEIGGAFVTRAHMAMDGHNHKAAIVGFQSHNRVVRFIKATAEAPNERISLINAISETYADKLREPLSVSTSGPTGYILQRKDEEWGGELLDFFDDVVPEKSVFKLILEEVKRNILT